MLTFEKVMEVFKDYLTEDTRYEVVMTSRGYTVLEWDSSHTVISQRDSVPGILQKGFQNVLYGLFIFDNQDMFLHWCHLLRPV